VLRPATPVSAVPVLPATRTPAICARVPVPSATAASIISVSAEAEDGSIARRHSRGRVRSIVSPPGFVMRSTRNGRMSEPPFATDAVTMAICSGETSSRSCPKASRPASTSLSSRGTNGFPFR
jgi:hypothetical protein